MWAVLLRFLLILTKFLSLGGEFPVDWFPLNVAKPKKGLTVAVLGLGAVGLAVIAEMTDGGVNRSIVCPGHIDAAVILAFGSVHDGWGFAVLVGVPHN
ncbi:hypothetical protein ACET3Z_009554 [Daucus carota]